MQGVDLADVDQIMCQPRAQKITGTKRPILVPADLTGIRMRVPAGEMVSDTFKAFGAEPVVINSAGIYDALKSGSVDAQENPLALVELFRLYEVVKYGVIASSTRGSTGVVA